MTQTHSRKTGVSTEALILSLCQARSQRQAELENQMLHAAEEHQRQLRHFEDELSDLELLAEPHLAFSAGQFPVLRLTCLTQSGSLERMQVSSSVRPADLSGRPDLEARFLKSLKEGLECLGMKLVAIDRLSSVTLDMDTGTN